MFFRLFSFILTMALLRSAGAATLVQMNTDMGDIDVVLFEELAPLTVQNFLNYMNKGATDGYDGTYIHRSIAGFIVQGGGYIFDPANGDFTSGGISQIQQDPPVVNEAGLPGALSNARGTLAMAKQPNAPDSAQSEWFFNQANNNNPADPNNLDLQNSGFTVFGNTTDQGLSIIDQIAQLPICYMLIPAFLCDAIVPPSGFTPFINLDPTQPVQPGNLMKLNTVSASISGDSDGDGVSDTTEDGISGTTPGDGNADGTPDSQQAHVTSLQGSSGQYITVEITEVNGTPVVPGVAPPARLDSVYVLASSFPLATKSVTGLTGYNFVHGFAGFNILGATVSDTVTTARVQIILPAGQAPDTYFKYGRTPANTTPHWYKFTFDGQTGADFSGGNRVMLDFVDGARGDSGIGIQDGAIREPAAGAVAFVAANTLAAGGGGGCSLGHPDAGIRQAGAWLAVFLLITAMRLYAGRGMIRKSPQP